jgi:hypothetical protein
MATGTPGHGNADALHRYWGVGEGAAKIRWGLPALLATMTAVSAS